MKSTSILTTLIGLNCIICSSQAHAQVANLDTIGLTELLARQPSLDGSGLTVAQVEAPTSVTQDPVTGVITNETYQPNPASAGQAASKFSYYDATNPAFNNPGDFSSSQNSGHANTVANGYYDVTTGVATDVDEILVFSANTFANNYLFQGIDINASIINQSFIFGEFSEPIDQAYDNYAALYDTLFVNGLNNGSTTAIPSPATMFNGISVGRIDLIHSLGPTDGRSKPDVIAPGTATSFATPYVSGSAAVLIEAANLEHGGIGTAADASDIRTVKALILNGAVKDEIWSNTETQPLDSRRGAGILNINNSHLQLEGGQHSSIESVNQAIASTYPPSGTLPTNNIASNIGWNYATITNASNGPNQNTDRIDNYYFDIPSTSLLSDVTASLVWLRQTSQSNVNNLDLILYNADTGDVVEQSISTVDNIEHIHIENLISGRYMLQVIKRTTNRVSISEDYALAFNFSDSNLDPLDAFRLINFGTTTNSENAANDADFDNDGLTNLTEYALGTDPTSAAGNDGGAAHPQVSVVTINNADYLQLTVTRAEVSPGISYFIDSSGEPGSSWVEATNILENTATVLRIRDSEAISTNNRRFMRFRVEPN